MFANQGYHGTSMRAIAKETGITQSSIYNHFQSKEAILIEIADVMKQKIAETFVITGSSRQEVLESYSENMLRSIRENAEFWRLIHSTRMNREIMQIVAPKIGEIQATAMEQISKLIAPSTRGASPEEVLLFWAAIDGIVAASLMIEGYPAEKVLAHLLWQYK